MDFKRRKNVDDMITALEAGKILAEEDLLILVTEAKRIMEDEGNVIHLNSPIVVIGDIHGQFYDLLEIFKMTGKVPVN